MNDSKNNERWCKECLFICYPKCSTGQKAKKWLDEHYVEYTERYIVENNPSYEELKLWHEQSDSVEEVL